MNIGLGIVLIAVGALLMLLINWTVGLILFATGILAIVLSFVTTGRTRGRDVVIERRPATRERVVERERKI